MVLDFLQIWKTYFSNNDTYEEGMVLGRPKQQISDIK